MERITFYDTFGKPCYRTKTYSEIHMGEVSTTISNDSIAQKLAAYEDTGLTPERVAELAAAERDGRLVVLPCKVDDTLFYNKDSGIHEMSVIDISLDGGVTIHVDFGDGYCDWDCAGCPFFRHIQTMKRATVAVMVNMGKHT